MLVVVLVWTLVDRWWQNGLYYGGSCIVRAGGLSRIPKHDLSGHEENPKKGI
jgi:hypothetical protein